MPRIAETIGTFALIAFAIGFNIVRYPVVWDMVAPAAQLAQADVSSSAEEPVRASAGPDAPAPSSAEPTGRPPAEAMPPQEKISLLPAGDRPPGPTSDRPKAVAIGRNLAVYPVPSSEVSAEVTSHVTGVGPSQPPEPWQSGRRLVPVVRPALGQQAPDGPDPPDFALTVRRLPPVGQVAPVPADYDALPLPMAPIPVYPHTGIE